MADEFSGQYRAMLYNYDQLHHIVQAQNLTISTQGSGFGPRPSPDQPYDAGYSYDANGNLKTLQRRDDQSLLADDFNYTYYSGTNRLR